MWKCAKAELDGQISCFPYVERPMAPASRKKSRRRAEESRTGELVLYTFFVDPITGKHSGLLLVESRYHYHLFIMFPLFAP